MAIITSVLALRSGEAVYSISVAGSLSVDLTIDQLGPGTLVFTGALTGSIVVYLPIPSTDIGASWNLINNTSGAYTLSFRAKPGGTATGATIAVAQGKRAQAQWNGTDLIALETDNLLVGAAASGANTDITSLAGLTGGVVGTGSIQFDSVKGNNVALAWGYLSKAYPSDANYTASASEMANQIIDVTGVISVQRNFVLPLTAGALYVVKNGTTGGFGVQFIAASGTGIVVANGKTAILRCDGTNYLRVTPDNP